MLKEYIRVFVQTKKSIISFLQL